MSVKGQNYKNLVMICAAQILKDGLNIWNRTNFDPTDGDKHNSDQIVEFTNDVQDQVRTGTNAIGLHPPRAGNPNALLGIYAYAGHRLPPSINVNSYVQVALAFNKTHLTYHQLIEGWKARAQLVMLREYWDTQAWSLGNPGINSRAKSIISTATMRFEI